MMKNKISLKRILALLCILVLTITIIPLKSDAAKIERYGYSKLTDSQKQIYHTLEEGLLAYRETITPDDNHPFSATEFDAVWPILLSDHPDFSVIGTCSYRSYSDGTIVSISPSYGYYKVTTDGKNITYQHITKPMADIKAANKAFNLKIKSIVDNAPQSLKTDYDKALYFHDYLVQNVEYDRNAVVDQTAYTAIMYGKAVCAGYARAYQALLNAAGINAWTVTGKAGGEDHAWNLVWMDGKCCYTDVTWDDPISSNPNRPTFHYYFNLSLEEMKADHKASEDVAVLLPPSCGHKDMNYFAAEQGPGKGVAMVNSRNQPESIADYMRLSSYDEKTKDAVYTCEVRFDGTDFKAWVQKAMKLAAQKVGMNGYQFSYSTCGKERIITLTGKIKEATVIPVTGVSLNPTQLSLMQAGQTAKLTAAVKPANATDRKVTFKSSDPKVAKVDPSTGVVTAVSSGKATITVTTNDGAKTAACAVIVSIVEVHQHDNPLRHVPGKAPTCTEPGAKDYYICDHCGQRFLDAGGKKPVSSDEDLEIAALGHTDNNSDHKCDRCGLNLGVDPTEPSVAPTESQKPTEPPKPTEPVKPTQPSVPGVPPEDTIPDTEGPVEELTEAPATNPASTEMPIKPDDKGNTDGSSIAASTVVVIISAIAVLGGGAALCFIKFRKH